MTFDFSNYDHLKEDAGKAREYIFSDVTGAPSVLSLPATTANRKYNGARLKSIGARSNQGRRKLRLSPESVEAARKENIELTSHFCIIDWGTPPVNKDGEKVPFSAKACEAFFSAIPDWMFEEYANWAADPLNFTEGSESRDTEDDLSPEEVGNFSQGTSNTSAD